MSLCCSQDTDHVATLCPVYCYYDVVISIRYALYSQKLQQLLKQQSPFVNWQNVFYSTNMLISSNQIVNEIVNSLEFRIFSKIVKFAIDVNESTIPTHNWLHMFNVSTAMIVWKKVRKTKVWVKMWHWKGANDKSIMFLQANATTGD